MTTSSDSRPNLGDWPRGPQRALLVIEGAGEHEVCTAAVERFGGPSLSPVLGRVGARAKTYHEVANPKQQRRTDHVQVDDMNGVYK